MQEPELIEGLRKGHEKAFEALVHLYQDKIYNTCLGLLQNEWDAEEVTQDVFIKVFESISHFRGEASLGTWLYRIAVTRSLDVQRKKGRKKRKGFIQSLFGREENDWMAADFHHPGVMAEQKENAAILFKAIGQLPEQQQAAFLLQKLEGLSQQEIADVLKTSAGAVESLLHRARTNLRKLLEDHYQKQYR